MRWFFALLILANIGFYFWRASEGGGPPEVAGVGVAAEGQPIVLLSEVELPDGGVGAGAPESLLSASSGSSPDGGAEDVAPVAAECWTAGPYPTLAAARLAADGPGDLKIRGKELSRSVEYWVYLGVYESYAVANAEHQQLRKKKIDSFVIRNGPLENAVSLGLFSDPDRAEVQAKRMRQKGYDAKVRKLEQRDITYWLSLEGVPGSPGWEAAYSQLIDKKNAEISVEKKSCNLVASWGEFD
ncbi:SPOR domain-containing protein [Spongiibacter taiwanensis]|uniref:SPOR domain-containing protein n=1 Tax=Spongiibacter taiwanensis TaxID=1748242 RepID=UPI0020350044|nr:SPOR domain-containing protein [Spongiibacter taiwanensis]USA44641.1 SPOR domain-containing protein [Spongiibacter taiwanensis]